VSIAAQWVNSINPQTLYFPVEILEFPTVVVFLGQSSKAGYNNQLL
jgi:hypothetical protein